MATFSTAGDELVVRVTGKANLTISIAGTYNLTLLFQKEVASPGSGIWSTLFAFKTPNATISQTYPHDVNERQRYRLFCSSAASGSATVTITTSVVSDPHGDDHTHPIEDLETTGTPDATTFLRGDGAWSTPTGGTWGEIAGTLSDQEDLQTALDAKAASSHTHDADDINANAVTKAKLNADVFENNAGILTGTANDEAITAAGLAYFRGLVKPVDGTASGGNIVVVDSTHAGQIIQADQNLTLDNGFPGSSWVQLINVHASTDITLTPEASGELNGDTQALTIKAGGGRVTVVCFTNAGTAPICDVTGDLVPVDFDGNTVQGNLAGTSAASMTLTKADSGKIIETTGNVTVPTDAGFNVTLVAGGAHTVSNGAITSSVMATGDVMSVFNDDDGAIHAVLVQAANKVVFS